MKANEVVRVMIDAGFEPRSYSGRFMYGRRCVALIITRYQDPMSVGFAIAKQLIPLPNFEGWEDEAVGQIQGDIDERFTDFIRSLGQIRQDAMGLDTVVYWPDLQWTPECDKEISG